MTSAALVAVVVASCLFLAYGRSSISDFTDTMYTDLQPDGFCVRLLAKDRVIGCAGHSQGILLRLTTGAEVDAFVGSEGPRSEHSVVLSPELFNWVQLQKLLAAKDRVASVLVLPSSAAPQSYSPETSFPNRDAGLPPPTGVTWNPDNAALGMSLEAFPFPIVQLSAEDRAAVIQRAPSSSKSASTYPRGMAEIQDAMQASENSIECLEDKSCLPVGGQSVWMSVKPLQETDTLIMGMTHLDASGFFHEMAWGADAAVAGTVALMGVAKALMRVDGIESLPKNILLAFFTGESWGYLGSKRFIQDVKEFTCVESRPSRCRIPLKSSLVFEKVNLTQIESIIELNQVGAQDAAEHTYHAVEYQSSGVKQITQKFDDRGGYKAGTKSRGIPPSSLMSFERERGGTWNGAGVVVSDHQLLYSNVYYGSRFDTHETVDLDKVCKVANDTAKVLYQLASMSEDASAVPSVDCDEIQTLYRCLTIDPKCDTIARFVSVSGSGNVTHYAGVFQWSRQIQLNSLFVHEYLADLTGKDTGESCSRDSDCDLDTGHQCVAERCVEATAYFHDAYAPSIEYNYDTNKWEVVRTLDHDPIWTESFWGVLSGRVYEKDDPDAETAILVLGIVLFLASHGAVFILRNYFRKQLKIA